MNKVYLENITWQEYHSKVKTGVLIIPVGATEQHSLHLPLGVDTIIAKNFAKLLAEKIDGLVAPAIQYGYKSNPTSGGGPLFPGTIDLNGKTLINLTQDLLVEFLADGWQRIIVMNSHYENQAFLAEAMDLVLRNQQEPFPKVLLISWWDNISEEIMSEIFDEVPFAGWDLEHAAITETSLMMYFAPDLVQNELIPDDKIEKVPRYQCYPVPPNLVPASGSLYTAHSSSAKKGKLIAENVIANFISIIEREFLNC